MRVLGNYIIYLIDFESCRNLFHFFFFLHQRWWSSRLKLRHPARVTSADPAATLMSRKTKSSVWRWERGITPLEWETNKAMVVAWPVVHGG